METLKAIVTSPVRGWRGFRKFRKTILWWLLWTRQKRWVIALIVTSFLSSGVSIGAAQVTATIFDEAIADGGDRPLMPLVITLAALALTEAFLLFVTLQISSRLEYQIEYDLRNRLYHHLQASSPRDLDGVATGQVVTRSLADLELLQILLQFIPTLVAFVPILIGYAIYLAFVNVPLTLLTCSLFAVNGLIVNRMRPRLWGLAFLGLHQQAEVTTAVDEPVRGIRVVKAFGAEQSERRRVRDAAAQAYRFLLTRARIEARFDLLLRAAPVLVRASLLLFGARAVVGGQMSIGKFVIFYTFLVEGTLIAQYLDEVVALWQVSKTGAGRITQLLALAPPPQVQLSTPLPPGSTGLEFHRAGARYGERAVVTDLDLAVRPGGMTVLTGGPGSGKSTVASMAAGLVPVTEGAVRLDGVDLRELDAVSIHRAVHIVGEDPFLFARTVRDNLTVGALAGSEDPDFAVPDAVLWDALRAAHAVDIVDGLPAGLDEILGDRGMTLSGGQRQRLALARALVVPPRVLVLDDALSAVNPALEVEILRGIREHAPETAILCITRRPGPMQLADTVVELPPGSHHRPMAAPGEVDEIGTPDVFAAIAASMPYDERLSRILGELKIGDDEPQVPERTATDHLHKPTLREMLSAQRKHLVVAVVALLVVTMTNLVPEFLFGEAADFIEARDTAATDRLAFGLIAVAVVVGIGVFTFRINSAKVSQGVLYGLRRRVFERLTHLGVEHYDRELPGYVSARVVHDIGVISRFLGNGFGEEGAYQLVSNVAVFLGAMGIITWLSPAVALVVLPFAIAVLALTLGQVRIADCAFARARARLGEVVARLQEDYAGRYVIRAFGAEGRAHLEFDAATGELRRARRWAAVVSNGYIAGVQAVLAIGAAAVYWRAGGLVLAGALTVGTVVSLRLYLDTALRPVRMLGRVWQDYVKARVSLRQLGMPFDVPVLPVERPDAAPCPPLTGTVDFDHVSFRYPGTDREVVHDLTLHVPAGAALAVVGYTGAGKSSIAKLLGRMYDPDGGAVRVDGLDLREVDLRSYRQRLGIVPQDAFVFRGTVASNIAYGRPDATREEVEEAARAVGAYEELSSLPGGLGATVEEEGRNLTAAARQLVALSRMWLVRPDVLVLDEATASLDTATEARVLDAVCSLGRTVVLVTHRIAAAERADTAVLIDAGRVVEQGTHDDLLAAGGAYARLWTWTGQMQGEADQPALT